MLATLEKGVEGGKWFRLFDKVFAERNLLAALQQVAANDGAPGVDHVTTCDFVRQLPDSIGELSAQIKGGEFTPQELAIWETDGVQHKLERYQYEQTRINGRDAVLIWQYKNYAMLLTTRIISPDRIVEANCTPGNADEGLYTQACDESVRTMKVAGPPSPQTPPEGGMEILPSPSPTMH